MPGILVINGPNLNLLGSREPDKYGYDTLDEIEESLKKLSGKNKIDFYQSNSESELVEQIHRAKSEEFSFIIINPAAFTHTSIAIRDALLGVQIPFIEVHLSNVFGRESFRQKSYVSDIAVGVVSGFGAQSYELALAAALSHLSQST